MKKIISFFQWLSILIFLNACASKNVGTFGKGAVLALTQGQLGCK